MTQKNFIVSGAMGNLGSATVEKFLREGHNVSALISHGKRMPSKENMNTYQADLANDIEATSAIEKIIKDHKTVYGAVLTVGGFSTGTIETTSSDDISKMIELNFQTAYNVVRPLLAHFKSQDVGRIVLVGAKPALERSEGSTAVGYTLSKSLTFKLSDLINHGVSGKNIKASVIVPNIIDTPSNRTAMPKADFSQWRTPADIADIIYELISSEKPDPVVKLY